MLTLLHVQQRLGLGQAATLAPAALAEAALQVSLDFPSGAAWYHQPYIQQRSCLVIIPVAACLGRACRGSAQHALLFLHT